MFRYKRISSNYMDLYFKGLHLQPGRTYELSLDIYGGPLNIFFTGYGIETGNGSHYVDYNESWTHYTFPFTTSTNSPDLTTFAEWGISLVKKEGERVPTHADDTYIDNVRLVCNDDPTVSVIEGGDFEAPKNNTVYNANWKQEILGLSGDAYGVDIVPDPWDRHNRCLLLPRLSRQEELSLSLCTSSFGSFKNSKQDISVSKLRSRDNHVFLLVMHGEAEIATADSTFTACSGQLVYLPPSSIGKITFRHGHGTAYYQIDVHTRSKNTILPKLSLPELTPTSLPNIASLCACVDTMLQYPTQSKTHLYAVNGKLFQFLAELEDQLSAPPTSEKYRYFIETLAQQLRETPEQPLYTAQKAAECGLSECYFITLFKQYTGLSPHRYRLRELVNKACILLQDTTMTVQEISYALGVDDPLYFSRLFRSFQGIPPTHYRKLRKP